MKLPRQRQYPKTILVGDTTYTVKFVRSLELPNEVGECDTDEHVISIKLGQSVAETYYTFIHEVVHAFEEEYDIKISHKSVYGLERAIGDFLLVNF